MSRLSCDCVKNFFRVQNDRLFKALLHSRCFHHCFSSLRKHNTISNCVATLCFCVQVLGISRAKVRIQARARVKARAEEIVKFRRVVGSDWLEYIYNV